jgi:hypothetical protein
VFNLAVYFKELEQERRVDLGRDMIFRIKEINYDESLALLTQLEGDLKPGMTIYPGDKLLVKSFEESEPLAHWYLVEFELG